MAQSPDPTVQRRRLRMELRRARDVAGQKQADVARAMDWSLSKLIRIESGQVGISTNDLRALLAHYNVKEKRRVDTLLELARTSRGQSWPDRFEEVLAPGFRDYLSFEAAASTIRQYEPMVVPGLLQVEDYALALLRSFGFGDSSAQKRWEVREQRQEIHDRSDPPEILIMLSEAVVRQQVGGPKVMRRQLERLKELAAQPYITLEIVPFEVGAHPGMLGPFVVLQFDDPSLDDLVHLEGADEATIRDDTEATVRYLERFAELDKLALPAEESIALIDDAIRQMSTSTELSSAEKEAS